MAGRREKKSRPYRLRGVGACLWPVERQTYFSGASTSCDSSGDPLLASPTLDGLLAPPLPLALLVRGWRR
jgi:hypothetical protein